MTRHCCPAPHAAAPAKLHARLDPFQHLMPMTSPPGAQKVQLSTVSRFSAMVEQDADSTAHALSNCHRSVVAGFMIGVMMRTLAATFVSLSLLISPGVPAHAAPDTVDPNANYSVFLQAIAGDGIRMDSHQAIREGQSVCMLMQPPHDGSLWDAGQQVLSTHSDWTIGQALKFADRSVQDICPHRGSF